MSVLTSSEPYKLRKLDYRTFIPQAARRLFSEMEIFVGSRVVSLLVCLVYGCSLSHTCSQLPRPDWQCNRGFMNGMHEIEPVGFGNVRGRQHLFPNINFTCEGEVSRVCFGGDEINRNGALYAEIQIWRRRENTSYYDKVNQSLLISDPNTRSTTENGMYVFRSRGQLHFEDGDILGIFVPKGTMQRKVHIVPRFVQGDVPRSYYNYYTNAAVKDLPKELDTSQMDKAEFLPAMKIITRMDEVSNSSSSEVSTIVSSSNKNVMTTVTRSSLDRGFTVTTQPSMRADPGDSRSDSSSGGIIGGVVGTIAVAVFVAVAVAVLLLIIIRQRRKGSSKPKQTSLNTSGNCNQLQLHNPVYTGEVSGRYEEGSDAVTVSATGANSRGGGTMASDYEEPLKQSGEGAPHHQSIDDDSSAPSYQVLEHFPGQTTSFNEEINLAEGTQHYEGIYVPTENQRRMLNNNVGAGVYSTLAGKQQVPVFFEEMGTYWRPASRTGEIYEQLAAKKYREISRKHIQITEHLGSGQYGTVNKGIWQSEGGAKEVAVKMLKAGSSEDDKVRFLQEAAINGQFRHANVVRLMGVVTLDEPVMIVLELLKNGDLRQYLCTLRPTPGEMVPSELPQTLLGFCREVAAGMGYLSRKGFVHRDLAARNILVAEDKTCKISDFGMSRDLEDTDYYVSQGGQVPVKWTAPEALHYKKYTSSSDVWSYGVVLYEIWSLGHRPFEGYTNTETIQMMDENFRLPPPPGCPRAIYRMMIDCWHPQGSSRPSFEQLEEDLSEPETELLVWTKESAQFHPLATTIGAALKAGQDLYTDLQQKYKTS